MMLYPDGWYSRIVILQLLLEAKQNRLNRCLKLGTQNLTTRFVAAILLTFKLFARFLIITVTDWNGQKSRRATIRNDHKLNCQQTKTTKKWKGHKPERPPTGQATNRKGHNRSHHILCRKFEKWSETSIAFIFLNVYFAILATFANLYI